MSDPTDGGDRRVPPLNACQSYRAGHQTHWIMAKRHHADREPGTVLGFDGDLVLVRCADGTTRRWWHHQPQRLRAAVAAFGSDVELIPGLPALLCSGYWFYCRRRKLPTPPTAASWPCPGRPGPSTSSSPVSRGGRSPPWSCARTPPRSPCAGRMTTQPGRSVLSVEVSGVAPDTLGRGPGTFGAWTATESGAALSVRFPVVGALARHRAALTTRAAVDLLRAALGDTGARPLMAVVPDSPTAAEAALPVLQDTLLWDLPGWTLRHDEDGTLAEWDGTASIAISVGRDEHLGAGLRFTASVATSTPPGTPPDPHGAPLLLRTVDRDDHGHECTPPSSARTCSRSSPTTSRPAPRCCPGSSAASGRRSRTSSTRPDRWRTHA